MSNFLTQYKIYPQRHLWGDMMPWILIGLVIVITGISALRFYLYATRPNISLPDQKQTFLYIRTGSSFDDVVKELKEKRYIKNSASLRWLAARKHYDQKVHAGRYRILDGMSNNALINLLRSGRQEPVRITIQGARTNAELAGRLGRNLETDSSALIRLFNDPDYLRSYNLTPATLFVIFIPNTYEFYWNTSGDALFARMQSEFKHFWSAERKQRADSLKLTIPEIITLASIIEKETNKNDEKPVMAGVYLNRLRKKIPLQADPTVIYAWNDYTIKRVLNKHTAIQSPYNTYLRQGLPPGPICIPSVASVDAVLNRQVHNYLYFCAREDLSGYHNFASTLAGHNQNAKRYQAELNKRNIK